MGDTSHSKDGVHIVYVWSMRNPAARLRSFQVQSPSWRSQARCDTLPASAVNQILKGWKNGSRGPYSAAARAGIERLVLVTADNRKRPRTLPALKLPDARFEPMDIDRSAETVLRLAMNEDELAPAVRRFWISRILRLWPLFLLIAAAPILVLVVNENPTWRWLIAASSLLILFASGTIYIRAFMGRWYLVPGGLLIQARSFLLAPILVRHTPRDSILRITQGRYSYFAIVGRRNGSHRTDRAKHLSRDQVRALLAAWQSPFEPPPLERCSDLR